MTNKFHSGSDLGSIYVIEKSAVGDNVGIFEIRGVRMESGFDCGEFSQILCGKLSNFLKFVRHFL